MKQKKFHFFLLFIVVSLWLISGYISLWASLNQYREIQNQKQEYPALVLWPEFIKNISLWNENTAADLQWIGLIQSIGSNIRGWKYLDFSHAMIDTIVKINPYFITPYEWALLLTPMRNSNKPLSAEKKEYIRRAVKIWSWWVEQLCNQEKLTQIKNTSFHPRIFRDQSLRNFCPDAATIAYYLWFQYSELDDMPKSRYYYTIAGLQDSAPTASPVLAVLSSPTYDQRKMAQKFLLMAASTPNIQENKTCIDSSLWALESLQKTSSFTAKWIADLSSKEKSLSMPVQWDTPTEYCFVFFERGVSQIYQSYITNLARGYPHAQTGEDLIASGALEKIPTTQTQSWFHIRKRQHNWQFYQ